MNDANETPGSGSTDGLAPIREEEATAMADDKIAGGVTTEHQEEETTTMADKEIAEDDRITKEAVAEHHEMEVEDGSADFSSFFSSVTTAAVELTAGLTGAAAAFLA